MSGLTGDELLTDDGVDDNADEAEDDTTVEVRDRRGDVKSVEAGVVVRVGHTASFAGLTPLATRDKSFTAVLGR